MDDPSAGNVMSEHMRTIRFSTYSHLFIRGLAKALRPKSGRMLCLVMAVFEEYFRDRLPECNLQDFYVQKEPNWSTISKKGEYIDRGSMYVPG